MYVNETLPFWLTTRLHVQVKGEQGGGHGTIRNTLTYFGNYWHDRDAEGEASSVPFFHRSVQYLIGEIDNVGMVEDVTFFLVCMGGMVVIGPLEA